MAKTLQSLINLAPSQVAETEVKVHWFTNQKIGTGVDWITRHGSSANAGGTKDVWIVPPGTSEITVHAWGSGGVGAGSHCCMQGFHAGAGAYAYKKITSGFSAGDRYVSCLGDVQTLSCSTSAAHFCCPPGTAAESWDATAASCTCYIMAGCKGITAYVTGPGLTNFCAEGGNPGFTAQAHIRGGCARLFDGPNGGRGVTFEQDARVRACDMLDRDPNDSDSSRFRTACYYGADGGSRGLHSEWQHGCCGCFEANCCNESGFIHWIAMPGGKWWMGTTLNSKYGYHVGNHYRNCVNTSFGMFGPHGTAERQMMMGSTVANNQFDNGGAMIGVGGASSWTCGGTCCCGDYGGMGLVAITYK